LLPASVETLASLRSQCKSPVEYRVRNTDSEFKIAPAYLTFPEWPIRSAVGIDLELQSRRTFSQWISRVPSGLWLLVPLLFAAVAPSVRAAGSFDQDHSRYARVLATVVKDSQVDYAKLQAAPQELDAYLLELASIPAGEFAGWSEADRLALLLNLYNAQTLRLIVDHYPVKSIRSIGFLPGAAWRELIVRFGGQIMTLGHLENEIIRTDYQEPRIHFALVCAAVGCPPLRDEPFVGSRLNEQLDDQTQQFLATTEKNRFNAETNTLHLSPIFKWYDEDFIKPAGSLAAYVKPFLPAAQRDALTEPSQVKERFTKYDWALNEQP